MTKGYRVEGGLFPLYVCHCIFVVYNMSVSVLVYVCSFCNKKNIYEFKCPRVSNMHKSHMHDMGVPDSVSHNSLFHIEEFHT